MFCGKSMVQCLGRGRNSMTCTCSNTRHRPALPGRSCRISHLYTNPSHNTSSFALRCTHAGTKIATSGASHRASRAPVAAEDVIASRRARQQSYTDNSCDACNTCGLSIQSRPSFCQVAATFLAREAHLPSPIRELSEVQVRSRATVVTIPPCERTRLIPGSIGCMPRRRRHRIAHRLSRARTFAICLIILGRFSGNHSRGT